LGTVNADGAGAFWCGHPRFLGVFKGKRCRMSSPRCQTGSAIRWTGLQRLASHRLNTPGSKRGSRSGGDFGKFQVQPSKLRKAPNAKLKSAILKNAFGNSSVEFIWELGNLGKLESCLNDGIRNSQGRVADFGLEKYQGRTFFSGGGPKADNRNAQPRAKARSRHGCPERSGFAA